MPRQTQPVKVACRVCHDRRVKCDRTEGGSCSNCRNAQLVCEPIASRRGRRRKLPLISSKVDSRGAPTRQHTLTQLPIINPDVSRNARPQRGPYFPVIEPNRTTAYVGDASNLNYLIQEFGNPFVGNANDSTPLQGHLHGAMVDRMGPSTVREIENYKAIKHESLQRQRAYDIPSQKTSRALLNAYLGDSLAALPILDTSRFFTSLDNGSVSPLLLNAIYLAATIYCSDSVITEAGFPSRYAASFTFYQRVKSLYDEGQETDAITTIQATFLMGYWWGGLLDPKDPYYWIGIAAGMAQAIGLHQAKSYIRLNESDRRLWRRLWWVIYAFDINVSMLLDRPPHVQGRLCNVPLLCEADFDGESSPSSITVAESSIYGGSKFMIHAVQLSRIVDQFFTIKYDEGSVQQRDLCIAEIEKWCSSLPPEIRSNSIARDNVCAVLMRIQYTQFLLLLHRSNPGSSNNFPSESTSRTCTEMFHMLEWIVENDLVYSAAANIVAPVLSVFVVQLGNLRRRDAGIQMVSKHRAHFCMEILQKLQDRYPIVSSFFLIFESLLNRVTTESPESAAMNTPRDVNENAQLEKLSRTGSQDHNAGPDLTPNLFDQALQDNMSTSLLASFGFEDLLEDYFWNSNVSSL